MLNKICEEHKVFTNISQRWKERTGYYLLNDNCYYNSHFVSYLKKKFFIISEEHKLWQIIIIAENKVIVESNILLHICRIFFQRSEEVRFMANIHFISKLRRSQIMANISQRWKEKSTGYCVLNETYY